MNRKKVRARRMMKFSQKTTLNLLLSASKFKQTKSNNVNNSNKIKKTVLRKITGKVVAPRLLLHLPLKKNKKHQ